MIDQSDALNQEQQIAVAHTEGPLLVLAGAGSGKTRIVTHRIAHLIESGVDPSCILAVTFTNKAAGEMQERMQHLVHTRNLSDFPTICTFHSLGVKILRESISHLGYHSSFVIYDEEDSLKLIRGCLKTLGVSNEGPKPKQYKTFISYAKNQIFDPDHVRAEDLPLNIAQSFPSVYTLYQERLKEAHALDFDDLLFLTVKLFKEHSNVLTYYQNRWHYLLIDEYQDTNRAQYLIARMLVEKNHNLFVVGDPDQSIYSWRGANIKNILNFENDYPGARIVRLEQNYRSRSNILDAANALILNNFSRYEKNLWSARGPGEKIFLYVADSDREEAGFVIDEIEQLRKRYGIPRKEMTIFYRTNFQSRVFEDFLLRKQIPYIIVGGISFYQRREIKDVLAFLHLLISDTDFISFSRTINLPKRGIGEATIEKIRLGAHQSEESLLAFCKRLGTREKIEIPIRLGDKQRINLKEFVSMLEELKALLGEISLAKLCIETVRKTGYIETLKEEKETFEDRKANVEELISKAAEWEILNDSNSLADFLEELSLKTTLDEAEVADDKVNLMTLHNGKGLEFTVTFLVGMEEDLFPHANSRENYESVEEERRLCYVGMTRAKERLYLSAASSRFLWGTHRMMRPSRFLKEVPKKYIERLR
ncbi:MAG: UvrD-helicase domain-containing protein [Chlamydiia bacterium]|nr:UvrD-helicase domain-containing protein [Chlamydiia bacterium]